MNMDEIARNRRKLNGETPNGSLHEGRPGPDGRMIYRDVNAEEKRPQGWRGQQSATPISDILRGKR